MNQIEMNVEGMHVNLTESNKDDNYNYILSDW